MSVATAQASIQGTAVRIREDGAVWYPEFDQDPPWSKRPPYKKDEGALWRDYHWARWQAPETAGALENRLADLHMGLLMKFGSDSSVAFLRAIRRYNPLSGRVFSTYAVVAIRRAGIREQMAAREYGLEHAKDVAAPVPREPLPGEDVIPLLPWPAAFLLGARHPREGAGLSLRELSSITGVTKEMVRQREVKACDTLKRYAELVQNTPRAVALREAINDCALDLIKDPGDVALWQMAMTAARRGHAKRLWVMAELLTMPEPERRMFLGGGYIAYQPHSGRRGRRDPHGRQAGGDVLDGGGQ